LGATRDALVTVLRLSCWASVCSLCVAARMTIAALLCRAAAGSVDAVDTAACLAGMRQLAERADMLLCGVGASTCLAFCVGSALPLRLLLHVLVTGGCVAWALPSLLPRVRLSVCLSVCLSVFQLAGRCRRCCRT
jgi:hypothetical protein